MNTTYETPSVVDEPATLAHEDIFGSVDTIYTDRDIPMQVFTDSCDPDTSPNDAESQCDPHSILQINGEDLSDELLTVQGRRRAIAVAIVQLKIHGLGPVYLERLKFSGIRAIYDYGSFGRVVPKEVLLKLISE